MRNGSDSKPTMPEALAAAHDYLRLLPMLERAIERSEISPRTSGGALQIGGGKRKWAPGDTSDVERWVLRHDWEITLASKIYNTLQEVTATFLEAQVLYWVIWKDAPFDAVADFLDVRVDEVKAAERSLLQKVADAMGPVEKELAERGHRRLGRMTHAEN